MKFLNRLERRFGDLAVVNLTLYLVGFQLMTLLICMSKPEYYGQLLLDHDALFAGEWWRLFTMPFMPPPGNPVFAFFAMYFFYFMGTELERHFGAFKYNLYLLIGYLLTIAAVLVPGAVVTNIYLTGSVILAFAWLYPDFTFLLFFILPCKMKWFALATCVFYFYFLLEGDWGTKAQVAAGVGNFLIFFAGDLRDMARGTRRRFKNQMAEARKRDGIDEPVSPVHQCVICGANLKNNPKMEFRYCPQCTGTPCYCIVHIHDHVHR